MHKIEWNELWPKVVECYFQKLLLDNLFHNHLSSTHVRNLFFYFLILYFLHFKGFILCFFSSWLSVDYVPEIVMLHGCRKIFLWSQVFCSSFWVCFQEWWFFLVEVVMFACLLLRSCFCIWCIFYIV